MKENKTILDYAKEAKNEFEKPVKHISLKYDEKNKRVYAEVTISDKEGNRLYYVYNEAGINYYLDCLTVQEHKSITDLLKENSLKINISDDFLNEEKGVTIIDISGKKAKVKLDLENGKVVYPDIVDKKKTETTKTVVKNETDSSKKSGVKSKIRIKNLKIIAGITALSLLAGYVGSKLAGGKNDVNNNRSLDSGNDHKIENQANDPYNGLTDEEIIYTAPTETAVSYYDSIPAQEHVVAYATEPTGSYYEYGSMVSDDNMETQIQVINDECFKYSPTSLYNLVYDNDRDAIFTIINMRNGIFEGRCNSDVFMNNAVNYIFECGNVFDGKYVKSFDSLSPYGQYIVLVSTQSILQLNPNYAHTTPLNNYNYDILVNSFDYMVDATYRSLTGKNITR